LIQDPFLQNEPHQLSEDVDKPTPKSEHQRILNQVQDDSIRDQNDSREGSGPRKATPDLRYNANPEATPSK
jgi:hypothetical protein